MSAVLLVWYRVDFPTHHIEEAESPSLKQWLARETVEKCKPKLYKNRYNIITAQMYLLFIGGGGGGGGGGSTVYLDYVEADVLVEGEESDNSETVVVPNSMNQEKLNQESKLGDWEWENVRDTHTQCHTHNKLVTSETYLSNSVIGSQSSLQPFSATDTNTNMGRLHQSVSVRSMRSLCGKQNQLSHLNHADIVGPIANSQGDGVLHFGLDHSNHICLL